MGLVRFKLHYLLIGIIGEILEVKMVAECGASVEKRMSNDEWRMKEFYLFNRFGIRLFLYLM